MGKKKDEWPPPQSGPTFILPPPPEAGDDRPRTAFGYLLDFGRDAHRYFSAIDDEAYSKRRAGLMAGSKRTNADEAEMRRHELNRFIDLVERSIKAARIQPVDQVDYHLREALEKIQGVRELTRQVADLTVPKQDDVDPVASAAQEVA